MDGCPRLLTALCLGLSCLSPQLRAQNDDTPPEVYLFAKVRDFKEANPLDSINTHPHFNTYNACSAFEIGAPTVMDDLDVTQAADGGIFAGDARGPALREDMPSGLARCFAPTDRFRDWFQDMGPDVNRAFQVEIKFTRDAATGLYVHKSDSFFPLDNGKPFTKYNATDPDPYGHLQTGTLDGNDLSLHNYGFTMEFHTRIVYVAGKGHRLSFQGDDDIWVFLNGKKVVDLGGVHQTQFATVDLDSIAASLGLADGNDYPMDFYFAERHTASSSFMITANLHIPSMAIRRTYARAAHPSMKIAAGSKVEVFDRGGRLVRSLRADADASPDGIWDGKDAHGRTTAPGMYYWRAQSRAAAPSMTGWVINGGRHD